MKRALSILLSLSLLFASAANAESPERSALIGAWAVDVSKLPMPPQARPKRVTIVFDQPERGRWSTKVEVVDASGATHRAEGVNSLDGTPAPVTGGFESDIASATMPTPDVLILTLGHDGVPGSTRIYTVVRGGTSMVETSSYFGDDGRPIVRTHYFDRL